MCFLLLAPQSAPLPNLTPTRLAEAKGALPLSLVDPALRTATRVAYVKPGLGPGRSHAPPRVVKKTSRRGALLQLREERCRAQTRTRAGPRGRRAARRGALALLGATLLFLMTLFAPAHPAHVAAQRQRAAQQRHSDSGSGICKRKACEAHLRSCHRPARRLERHAERRRRAPTRHGTASHIVPAACQQRRAPVAALVCRC
jgi:hypothetical protein